MATVVLTIPNAAVTRLAAAIGYQATINGVANPVQPAEAVRAYLANTVKDRIKTYESEIAAKVAIATTNTDVDTIIIT